MNPLKWWFNRKPYIPAISIPVQATPLDQSIANKTASSQARSDLAVAKSRNLTLSVLAMHQDLLRIIEGGRT